MADFMVLIPSDEGARMYGAFPNQDAVEEWMDEYDVPMDGVGAIIIELLPPRSYGTEGQA